MIRSLAVVLMTASASVAQSVPEPSDYRMDHYRSPVPEGVSGATTIGPEQAHALWEARAAGFIDVLPRPPKPANLPKGTIWRDKPRNSIPGAIWVPNVGYGAIADVTAAYFQKGLIAATRGDPNNAVVLFCLEDCWMSWNAARRALEWGYTNIYWFPEGTDGWALWGYPLEKLEALPGEPGASQE